VLFLIQGERRELCTCGEGTEIGKKLGLSSRCDLCVFGGEGDLGWGDFIESRKCKKKKKVG